MIFGFSILATALLLSTVAAWYSIAGLVAIFSAAAIPVIIMGGSLELGKIVATVWLHNNWRRAPLMFKVYLVPAVAFLMLLTSMGIFGYLSKAHSDQSLVSGDSQAQIAIFDEKIKTQRDNIETARRALQQMDAQVEARLSRGDSEAGAERAVQIRRQQAAERTKLQQEIAGAQRQIAALQEQRAPLAAEFRKIEAEVGPIKYIAALIYGDNPDANLLERAVRWVIIMIVLVFDPLALTLILAANKQFEWARQGQGGFVHDEPKHKPDEVPQTAQQVDQTPTSTAQDPSPPGWMFEEQSAADTEKSILEKHPYLDKPFRHFENTQPMVAQPEPEESDAEYQEESAAMQAAMGRWKEDHPNDTLKHQRLLLQQGRITELPWIKYLRAQPASGFGKAFPEEPAKGATWIRTDIIPNVMYKFNGDQWMVVDKSMLDNYNYDVAYVDHLIDRIGTGEYDPELLTESEQEQIAQRLQTRNNA